MVGILGQLLPCSVLIEMRQQKSVTPTKKALDPYLATQSMTVYAAALINSVEGLYNQVLQNVPYATNRFALKGNKRR